MLMSTSPVGPGKGVGESAGGFIDHFGEVTTNVRGVRLEAGVAAGVAR